MQADSWPKWKKASPEFLIRYVNSEAARDALPRDVFTAESSPTFEDLRRSKQLKKIIHVLYDKLRALNVQYDREPPSSDESEQPIRTPYEIIASQQGTCLDLTLLFAAVCVEVHLLPILVLLRAKDCDHAIVVVDTKYTWDQRDDARGWKEEDRQNGWIRGPRNCWQERGEFARDIDQGRYVPVECTGFAQSQAHGGLLATLSFEEACTRAMRNLATMEHIATLDVARMKSYRRGYEPYALAPNREIRDEIVRQKYAAAVRRTFCELEFAGLSIEGATSHILSPDRAFRNVRFTPEPPADKPITLAELQTKAATVILGPPGAGKSGTLKLLLDIYAIEPETLPVYLPLRDLSGISSAITETSFFACMEEQADEQLGISGATREFFKRMLESQQCTCVLAFDALDELGDIGLRRKAVLALRQLAHYPKTLIFLTSRPDEYRESPVPDSTEKQAPPKFKTLYIKPFGPEEIREYLHVCFQDDGSLAERIVTSEELTELARGPLPLGLLAMLAKARGGELPNDPYALFEEFVKTAIVTWEQIKGRDADAPPSDVRRPLLERLAWAVHDRENSSAPLLEGEALSIVGEACRGVTVTGDPTTVLNWLARRTGLIRVATQHGRLTTRRTYNFLHPQVREFLAGCELARRLTNDFDNAFTELHRRLFDMAWREVMHFAVGNLSRKGAVHNRLLGALLAMNVPHDDLLHRRLFLVADLMCHCDFLDEAHEENVVRDLCTIGGTDACMAARAIHLVLQLGRQKYAQSTLISLALGNDETSALRAMAERLSDSMAEELRVEAARAICAGKQECASTVLETVSKDLTSMRMRVYLTRCWSDLGQCDRAKHELMDLKTQADDDSSLDLVIAELRQQGFEAEAVTAEQEKSAAKRRALFSMQGADRWQCAEWLWDHGVLEPNGIELQSMFASEILTLKSLSPIDPIPWELSSAMHFAERLANTGIPHAAEAFLEIVRSRPEVRGLGPETWAQMTDGEAESWHKTLVEIAKSDVDNSRRRGVVYKLIQDTNNDRSLSSLLDLLRNERTLRWTGFELVRNLKERGLETEAISTLVQLASDAQEELSTRLTAATLLDEFFPESLSRTLEKSFAGLDEAQAAASIVDKFGNWGTLSGPVLCTLTEGLAKDPKGVRILKAIQATLPADHSLRWAAENRLLGTLAPRDALASLANQWLDEEIVADLALRLMEHGMAHQLLELVARADEVPIRRLRRGTRRSAYGADFILALWNRGDRQKALDWGHMVLSHQDMPILLKLVTAERLVEWGESPHGFTIPDWVLRAPEEYCTDTSTFGLASFFRLLNTLSGATVAEATFTQLLERGLKSPEKVLDALDQAGDVLPWQPGWTDLVAEATRRTDPTNNLRCRLISHLEKRLVQERSAMSRKARP